MNLRDGKEENKAGERYELVPQVWIPFALLKIKGQGDGKDGFNLRWKEGGDARDAFLGGAV